MALRDEPRFLLSPFERLPDRSKANKAEADLVGPAKALKHRLMSGKCDPNPLCRTMPSGRPAAERDMPGATIFLISR